MASNDQWPPVASTGRGTPKVNGNKRNIMDSQQNILSVVNEMFGSALETEVILGVVQNCNWELQPSIEGLITLTETVDNPLVWNSPEKCNSTVPSTTLEPTCGSGLQCSNKEASNTKMTVSQSSTECRTGEATSKLEKSKKGGTKNRMGSFCGNIAKLKSSTENNVSNVESSTDGNLHKRETATNDDFTFDGILNYGAMAPKSSITIDNTAKFQNFEKIPRGIKTDASLRSDEAPPWSLSNPRMRQSKSEQSFSPPMMKDTSKKENFQQTKAAAEDKEFNVNKNSALVDARTNPRKSESESLCGLKVQYRVGGMESSSDDDADVVIEDESSDYKVDIASSMSINVSQFLSPSTQTPPRRTLTELQMISTPSPPRTPERNAHLLTLNRVKLASQKGHRIMILLRGLPGSGKSTLAKSIVATTVGGDSSAHVFNTDDFFVALGRGVHNYDPSRIQEAHAANQKKVRNAAKEGRSPIIVDNTHIEAWEMRSYLSMAVEHGYIVEIIEPDTPWSKNVNQLAKKNLHNVPKSKIRDLADRYERVDNVRSLLERYNLKYSSKNNPPQLRLIPEIATDSPKITDPMDEMKSNWDNHGKNNYVLTSHDIESMQNIDENHSELASSAHDSDSSLSNDPERSKKISDSNYDDYMKQLQHSDDESFEIIDDATGDKRSNVVEKINDVETRKNLTIVKSSKIKNVEEFVISKNDDSNKTSTQQIFGAIGSERKGSLSMCTSVINNDRENPDVKNLSPTGTSQILGAIGSERKNGSSTGSSVVNVSIDNNDNTDSNDCQQSLGAIGSERKESFSRNSSSGNVEIVEKSNNIDDNVLSPCWDFTLILGRSKIHSCHENVKLFVDDKIDDGDNVADEKNDDEILKPEPVVITEIIETSNSLSNVSTEDSFDEILTSDVETNKCVETLLERDNDCENNENQLDPEKIFVAKFHEAIADETESSESWDSSMSKNLSLTERFGDIIVERNENTESQTNQMIEVSECSTNAGTAFGTFLNMLKTSILGGTDEDARTNGKKVINEESDSSIVENAISHSPSTNDDNFVVENVNTSREIVNEQLSSNLTSKSVFPTDVASNVDDRDVDTKIVDNNDERYGVTSTNPFRDEIMMLQREKSIEIDETIFNDNINSITWKESPFPIDATKIPIPKIREIERIVEKVDASTNTSYYDFNVDYVGGTSEPGYREIATVSRCINEGSTVKKIERPPLKLMLDKSSSTNESNILAGQSNSNLEITNDPTNDVKKLVELFPDTPINTLEAFYKQQCKGNFNWAVEVLLEDVPTNFTINDLEIKRRDSEFANPIVVDGEKKCQDNKNDRSKIRGNCSTTKNRRQRSKDFRCFTFESVDDRSSGSGEPSLNDDDATTAKDDEEIILQSFYDNATNISPFSNENDETRESVSTTTNVGEKDTDDDVDDFMEIDFGREFVDRLEKMFGNADFALPEELKTVVRIKKSMAEELHAIWIQSMYEQLNERHAKLDEMIAKDEEMARALDREETVQSTKEPAVPNLEEIMAMEMAMASYENGLKAKIARETPNDMASRLTRQMLWESWPDIDRQTLSELLKAHGGDFEETCRTIETSTDTKISESVTLKRQQSLLERIKQESENRQISKNLDNFAAAAALSKPDVNATGKVDQFSYEDALARARDARKEAQKEFSLHIENYNKAAAAYGRGHPGIAAYYSQMAKLHSANSRAAHDEATDAFVLAQTCRTDNETLDLHNMCVAEALRSLDTFVGFHANELARSNKRSSSLRIITGRGARSTNGFSRIKPAVCKRLQRRNIRYIEENAGCLKVTLTRKNCTPE